MKHLLLFLGCLVLPLVVGAQRTGTDYAVFFVASKFDNGWATLDNAPAEVKAIGDLLRDQYGFDVRIVTDATRTKIVQTLAEYKRKTYGPQDQLLLFFSMHGVHDRDSDQGYLVPKDGLYDDPSYESWYSHAALRDLAHSMKCPRVLVALDACYSGIFGKGRDKPGSPAWENAPDCQTKLRAAFGEGITRKYLTAGGDTRVPAKSIFAAQWQVALKNGAGSDDMLSYTELMAKLDEFRDPRPTWGNFIPGTDGDFVFVRKNPCAATPGSTKDANRNLTASDLDKDQWRQAEAINTLDSYRKYLRNCGDYCLYKEDAEAAISRLVAAADGRSGLPKKDSKQEPIKASNKIEIPDSGPVLFTIGNLSVSVSEFEEIYKKNNQDKADYSEKSLREYLSLYTDFKIKVKKARDMHFDTISTVITELDGYKKQLSKSYSGKTNNPEYLSLVRQYEDGILLFEATKRNVWDFANKDSIGLEKYFNQSLIGKYNWGERARLTVYSLKSIDQFAITKVLDYAASHNSVETLAKFNKKEMLLSGIEKFYEKGKNTEVDNHWNNEKIWVSKIDNRTQMSSLLKIEQILPPMQKTLNEARGYAVADYQDYLEKQWLNALHKEYKVTINDFALSALVKK